MTRVKISLPEIFPFSTEVLIRMSDVNMGGHVGSDAYHSILNDVQLRFMKERGFEDAEFKSYAYINTDFSIIYKSECYYGDSLIIQAAAVDFFKFGFNLIYKLSSKNTEQDVAIAKTGILLFDYQAKKKIRLSDELKLILTK